MQYKLKCGTVIQIDPEDLPLVQSRSWRVNKKGYVRATTQYGTSKVAIALHREILQASPGVQVDHRNGDPLDNRRENLRLATLAQNNQNRRPVETFKGKPPHSPYKGVSYNIRTGKWVAIIGFNGNRKHLGVFTDEIKAAKAYDRAAVKFHKGFARLNFPIS